MIDVICKHCGKTYKVKPYQVAITKYCSRKCGALGVMKQITKECGICKNVFTHISARCNTAKYCSNRCRYKAQIDRGKTEYTCHHCHQKFWDSQSCKRKYCSKKCVNKSSIETWKGNYTSIRKNMLTRGLINECIKCGYNEYPQILGVHHIDENRENNQQNNLAVLCPNCHSIEHMKHIAHGDNR